jgi:hypothetical protein
VLRVTLQQDLLCRVFCALQVCILRPVQHSVSRVFLENTNRAQGVSLALIVLPGGFKFSVNRRTATLVQAADFSQVQLPEHAKIVHAVLTAAQGRHFLPHVISVHIPTNQVLIALIAQQACTNQGLLHVNVLFVLSAPSHIQVVPFN